MGISLTVPLKLGVPEEINFDLSVTESLVDYYQDSITSMRFKVGAVVDLRYVPVLIKPEFNIMRDLKNSEVLSWFGVTTSF